MDIRGRRGEWHPLAVVAAAGSASGVGRASVLVPAVRPLAQWPAWVGQVSFGSLYNGTYREESRGGRCVARRGVAGAKHSNLQHSNSSERRHKIYGGKRIVAAPNWEVNQRPVLSRDFYLWGGLVVGWGLRQAAGHFMG